MTAAGWPSERALPPAYVLETDCAGAVSTVWVRSPTGELAARGYAAETYAAFVYDRIVTAPDNQRQGLGHVVMNALRRTKRVAGTPELLVATEAGRMLYEALGWRVLSPYTTASIVRATASGIPPMAETRC